MKDNKKHDNNYSATLSEAYDAHHKEMKNKRFMKRATEKSRKEYLEAINEEDEEYLHAHRPRKGRR